MTFDNAIRNLTDGHAAKFASWGGYVYRTDIFNGIPLYSVDTEYGVNDLVIYLGKTYVCAIASEAGEWDPACWLRATKYTLTFRRRSNSVGQAVDTVYTFTPTVVAGSVVYKAEPDGYDGSEESPGEFENMLPLDATLLQAFCSNDWIIGKTLDFEHARTGTVKIW